MIELVVCTRPRERLDPKAASSKKYQSWHSQITINVLLTETFQMNWVNL